MGQEKMRELERAARQLGVTSTTLRQQEGRTASSARVKAAEATPGGRLRAAGRSGKRGSWLLSRCGRGSAGSGDAAYEAARYRAGRFLRRALGE
jgi:hypothetical protein